MNMLDKIHNPITNKWVNISGKTGKTVLTNYIKTLNMVGGGGYTNKQIHDIHQEIEKRLRIISESSAETTLSNIPDMTCKIKDVNYIGTEDIIRYSPEIDIDIFIKGILVATIRISISIHHGMRTTDPVLESIDIDHILDKQIFKMDISHTPNPNEHIQIIEWLLFDSLSGLNKDKIYSWLEKSIDLKLHNPAVPAMVSRMRRFRN